jgi:hypothetical protein
MGEEEREEKGFVIKDRRKISLEDTDETREQTPKTEEKESIMEQEPTEADAEQEKADTEQVFEQSQRQTHVPLPEVTFSTFVVSLSQSALLHLGEIPDLMNQEVQVDLSLAKHVIDTLGMLEEKTRGNLDSDEERLLKEMLYNLRMRFVQKSSK